MEFRNKITGRKTGGGRFEVGKIHNLAISETGIGYGAWITFVYWGNGLIKNWGNGLITKKSDRLEMFVECTRQDSFVTIIATDIVDDEEMLVELTAEEKERFFAYVINQVCAGAVKMDGKPLPFVYER